MNRILVTGVFSDRCYAAIQTEKGFLFHCCSNLNGFDEKEFQRAVSVPGPKDIVIDRIQILSKELRVYSPEEQRQGCGAKISLLTSDGIRHQFHIGKKHGLPELRRFFDLREDEIRRPERNLDYGKTLQRREKDEALFLLLYLLCFVPGLLVFIGAVFLPYALWLGLGLASLLAPPALAMAFPQWFTLTKLGGESRFRYGKRLYPACVPMLVFPFYLAMRLPEVTYLSLVGKVLLFVFPLAPLALAVWFLSPERKISPKVLALTLAAWAAFGAGTGYAVNCADYYCSEPDMREQRRVDALEDRAGSNGQHSYYVHMKNAEGELVLPVSEAYYRSLTRSSFVTVDFYDGVLGVPYAYICEDYE